MFGESSRHFENRVDLEFSVLPITSYLPANGRYFARVMFCRHSYKMPVLVSVPFVADLNIVSLTLAQVSQLLSWVGLLRYFTKATEQRNCK